MPLSPQDKAYWKDKLGWKAAVFLIVSTIVMGCVVWPIMLVTISATSGQASAWTWKAITEQVEGNFMLALLVSTIMWFIGQLYIWMDWLPPRRR
jgi:hypothetical protein